jgi:transcriptional regulator with XRE-family HTH domain
MRRVVPLPFPAEPLIRDAAALGAAIRSTRTRARLTRADAALSLGISVDALADLERGKPTVALGTALAAATALGVSLFITPAEQRDRVRSLIKSIGT